MAFDFSNIPWMKYMWAMTKWAFWIVLTLFVLGIAWFNMYIRSFRIKVLYWPIIGTGNNRESIDNHQKNRFRWSKDKTYWQCLWPLFNHDQHEPFPQSKIYPGNNVYAYKMGDKYVPAEIQVGDVDKKETMLIKPIPYYARRWQALELKQNEVEFTKKSWWDENKSFVMAMFTVVVCCAACVITIWWAYQYSAESFMGARQVGQDFITRSIQNVAAQGAPQ